MSGQRDAPEVIRSGDVWAALAGLRFVLAAMVLVGHIGGQFRRHDWTWLIQKDGVHVAVIGFFLVSGYAISHSLSARPDGFGWRRFHRIYWVYLAALLASTLPFWALGHAITLPGETVRPPTPLMVVGSVLMVQGLLTPDLSTNVSTWSLSVECLFYLCAPLFARMRGAGLAALVIASALAALLPRLAGHAHPSTKIGLVNAGMLLWAWLGGFVYQRAPQAKSSPALLFVPGIVLMGVYYGPLGVFTVTVCGLLIAYGGRLPLSASWRRILDYGGELSYPLYLLHIPALYLCWALWRIDQPALLAGGALVAAALCYHGVDLPARRLVRSRLSAPAVTQSGTLEG